MSNLNKQITNYYKSDKSDGENIFEVHINMMNKLN